MSPRTALIAGATGLVGSHCLGHLRASADYGKLIVVTRRRLALKTHSKPEERVVDFDHLSAKDAAGADDIFCALGTTIKKAGSQAAFRKVDFDAVVNLARAGIEAGAKRFIVVSSIGANPKSSNFYLRVKGEMEQAVSSLPFEAVHIMRPSLLLGPRQESRPGEQLAQAIMPLLNPLMLGPLRDYRAIPAETVARAMITAAATSEPGVHVHTFEDIMRLAS
jgi:uncharacterized protein YbjT (DUF2867 family)